MGQKRRKRKYVVDMGDEEEKAVGTVEQDDLESLGMRITLHGKINGYTPPSTLRLFAEGPAVSKLVTVVEIVKRSGRPNLISSTIAVGDGNNNPRKRHTSSSTAEQPNQQTRGMYGSRISKELSTGKTETEAETGAETQTPTGAGSSSWAGDVWMQATLGRSGE
ncbi:hypothetical protein GGF46_001089 [Coemansia sp. RSA 552]|nr:hypothetical protein GGF46_001089 [Coemansia sp. RSA 552]